MTVGLGAATCFALFSGTAALPFVVASCVGFTIGSVGFYQDALRKAVLAVEQYPLLLRLHLHANFPHERFDKWDIARMKEAFVRERGGDWRLRSMLVVGWTTATPALDVR